MRRFTTIICFGLLAFVGPLFARAASPDPFVQNVLTAIGHGTPRPDVTGPGTRKVMALRAAELRAYARLLEITQGVYITTETTVNDVMFGNETVTAKVQGWVKGAQTIKQEYDPATQIARVHLRLPLKGSGSLTEALLPSITTIPKPQGTAYAPLPGTAPPAQPADGLIVDVRGESFRPAFLNRILSVQGEVLYEPGTIPQSIYVEHGSGGYTTDLGKAKALLSERGSRNPLTVQADDNSSTTDVHVGGDDAAAIFAANQETRFLEAAKVVFVVRER